jgi:putative addiction module component (TIGR02574 family)
VLRASLGLTGIPDVDHEQAHAYSLAMTHRDIIENALALPPTERLEIIAALWDSIGGDDVPLTAAQAAEIDRRLASFEADKADVMTWDDFKAELEGRAR